MKNLTALVAFQARAHARVLLAAAFPAAPRAAAFLAAAFLAATPGCAGRTEKATFGRYSLIEVARSDRQWTGVAVSRSGRIFVNYPRWSAECPVSVAELKEGGEAVPFPDSLWNKWDPSIPGRDRFVCVQSVYVDDEDLLWVLDPASPWLRGVIPGSAKLVGIDLETGGAVKIILFDSLAAPQASYLNDVRVDTKARKAYITDSGMGGIVIVDLDTGGSRRVLDGHPSTMAEDIPLKIAGREIPARIHCDGIALDAETGFLYYKALTSSGLYRVRTRHLLDRSLGAEDLGRTVELVGRPGPADGLLFHAGGIFLTSIEESAVKFMTPGGEIRTVASDSLLEWPDSFAKSAAGDIYVTTSRIAYPPGDGEAPCRLFRLGAE